MRIGIDAREAFTGRGISKYISGLLGEYRKQGAGNIFYLFTNNYHPPESCESFKWNERFTTYRTIWEQFHIPLEIINNSLDVFHCPANMGVPVSAAAPVITTIHDIIPLVLPDIYKNLIPFNQYEKLLSNAVRHSEAVITGSEFSKNDIMKWTGLSGDKIHVIFDGIDPVFLEPRDPRLTEALKIRHSIEGPYILYSGGIDPRKNIPFMLDAFRIIEEKHGKGLKFVITGGRKELGDLIGENTVHSLSETGKYIFTGHVTDAELAHLCSGALALFYPTLYEGFGLPLLEAFASGTPAAAGKVSSLPEIGRDAVHYIDIEDPEKSAEMLCELLENTGLREKLVKRGKQLSELYTWDKTAAQTLRIYEDVKAR